MVLPEDMAIVAFFYDVETGRADLATRGRGRAHEQFDIPLRRDGGIQDLLDEAGRADRRFDAVICESVDRVARSGCDLVGIDISQNTLEYPFQALLRERRPGVQFVHTGVPGAVARPCAVLCLDCAENEKKMALYSGFGPPIRIGQFLLYSISNKP